MRSGRQLPSWTCSRRRHSARTSASRRSWLRDPSQAAAWSPDGFTALHFAAFFGGITVARRLLDAGAPLDVVSRNDFGVAPLNSAAAGQQDVAFLLVERGADVDVKQRHGWTPLMGAADHGNAALVDALVAAHADVGARNDLGPDGGGHGRRQKVTRR